MWKPLNSKYFFGVSLAILAAIGAYSIYYATVFGPGGFSDSTAYLVAARNFLDGHGLTIHRADGRYVPLPLRPPFYPLFLSLIGITGLNEFDSARWFHVILFALLIILVGICIYKLSDSMLLGLLTSVLFLASPLLIESFTTAMSEPLFIFVTGIAIGLLYLYWDKNTWQLLVLAAIAAGLAMLTRFIGAALLVPGVLVILLGTRSNTKTRFIRSIVYGLLAITPTLMWMIYLRSGGGVTGVYDLNVSDYWASAEPVRVALVRSLWEWNPITHFATGIPYGVRAALIALLWLTPIALLFLHNRFKRSEQEDEPHSIEYQKRLIFILLMYSFAFVGILTWSYLFVVDPKPALYDRILLPIILIAILLPILIVIIAILLKPSIKWIRIPLLLIMGVFILSSMRESAWLVRYRHSNGHGYFTRVFKESETLHTLKAIPDSVPIITNEYALVLLYTNRAGYNIPEIQEKDARFPFETFGENPRTPEESIFRSEGAVLVLFDSALNQFERIYGDEAQTRFDAFVKDLVLYEDTNDGAIFTYPD